MVAVFVWWCDYAGSGGAYINIDDACGSVGVGNAVAAAVVLRLL